MSRAAAPVLYGYAAAVLLGADVMRAGLGLIAVTIWVVLARWQYDARRGRNP